ncbi:hypothetical protein [Paenibacillus sp. FSL R7-0331]|uniref:hypothetical protein n=1 Tax=Paenibacillus sp. FSL R7-0331 TaxID=1536773 RepID=UPI000693D095|nr:hypothetical protein [Paenibacillus sp. FSL R7-0331]
MIILGTIVAIVTAIIISSFLGPYGLLTMLAVGFGFLFSIHARVREVQSDLKQIKQHLGITEAKEAVVSNAEIEAELEREMAVVRD